MANEKSAVSEFLKEAEGEKSPFATEEKPLFEEPIKEEGSTEEPEEVAGEKDEKPVPFHKDPRVQRYVEKQIEKAIKNVQPTEVDRFKEEVKGDDEITDVLVRIIGNDTPEKQSAVKDFRKVLGSLEERGAQKALAELSQQAEKQREADIQAQRELDEAFEEIEETYNVDLSSNAPSARKARTDFIDYVRKIAPKDEDGEVISFPDMTAAYEEFKERSKPAPSNTRAKELAARGLSRSSDATTQPKGGSSWKDVEKLFNKLS